MSGTWSKLKKTISITSSKRPPTVPERPGSESPSLTSSSSLSSRLSRSFSIASPSRSSQKICAICLGIVRVGHGQAIFTAECSHSFHFGCISSSVNHGNHLCPICRAKWKEIPFQLHKVNADADCNAVGRLQVSPYQTLFENHPPNNNPRVVRPPAPVQAESLNYSDDEPLLVVSADLSQPVAHAPSNNLAVKTFPEFPAVAAAESITDFAVLVSVKAPMLLDNARQVERASIDLVLVLDVSGSMTGSKLVLMKHAVCFIIENLGPGDRLSLISFSFSARRIFPLCRMTQSGREEAKLAVSSLSAEGGTNIVEGLRKGIRVIEDRRERNSVASIILLSDGKDTYNNFATNCIRRNQNSSNATQVPMCLKLLSAPIFSRTVEPQSEVQLHALPVHTFGFGANHDSNAMHAISDASGGTFSFIETTGTMQDAFARCIGGLLSVCAKELRLTVASASPGVEIRSIPSGRYASEISELGKRAVINIGELYVDEEKEFLVNLSIPECQNSEGDRWVGRTSLLKISCSFSHIVSQVTMQLEDQIVDICRPNALSSTDAILSLEVDRQKNRLWVAQGIAEAREMADAGNLDGAQAVLTNRISTLTSSASAQAGDGLCIWLEAEVMEIRNRMADKETYERSGRSYVLSGLSAHSLQRATTRGDSGNSGCMQGYDTPSMISMVSKSQNLSAVNPPEQVLSRQYSKSASLAEI